MKNASLPNMHCSRKSGGIGKNFACTRAYTRARSFRLRALDSFYVYNSFLGERLTGDKSPEIISPIRCLGRRYSLNDNPNI